MASIYYDDPAPETRVWNGAFRQLPITAVHRAFFDGDHQRLIPFLGSGASLPAVAQPSLDPPAQRVSADQLDRICNEFGIVEQTSRRFVQIALQFAQLLEQRSKLIQVERPDCAPTSWELARLLARALELEPYRALSHKLETLLDEHPTRADYGDIVDAVAQVMGLSRSIPQLLTVASYFREKPKRSFLQDQLFDRFRLVDQTTPIQKSVAKAAASFVKKQNASSSDRKSDYIIITTNYDLLMEKCLDEEGVPTCVVTVDKKARVYAEFMPGTTAASLDLKPDAFARFKDLYASKPAVSFGFDEKPRSMAMVYKIHGCPKIDRDHSVDNIVISDQDYVLFIRLNGKGNDLIPACIQKQLETSGFLFLGYSFSDWNVRELYQDFFKNRLHTSDDDEMDYIVLRSYSGDDDYLLKNYGVSVLVTDLDKLAGRL